MTGETALTEESHQDEFNSAKVWKTKYYSIFISDLKTYVLPILGVLGKYKE